MDINKFLEDHFIDPISTPQLCLPRTVEPRQNTTCHVVKRYDSIVKVLQSRNISRLGYHKACDARAEDWLVNHIDTESHKERRSAMLFTARSILNQVRSGALQRVLESNSIDLQNASDLISLSTALSNILGIFLLELLGIGPGREVIVKSAISRIDPIFSKLFPDENDFRISECAIEDLKAAFLPKHRNSIQTDFATALNICYGTLSSLPPLICSAVYCMIRYTKLSECISNPKYLMSFVEEVCRFICPTVFVKRTCVLATNVAEYEFKSGDTILCYIPGSNFDPDQFSRPSRFDPLRPNLSRSLAFGTGPHSCLFKEVTKNLSKEILDFMINNRANGVFKHFNTQGGNPIVDWRRSINGFGVKSMGL